MCTIQLVTNIKDKNYLEVMDRVTVWVCVNVGVALHLCGLGPLCTGISFDSGLCSMLLSEVDDDAEMGFRFDDESSQSSAPSDKDDAEDCDGRGSDVCFNIDDIELGMEDEPTHVPGVAYVSTDDWSVGHNCGPWVDQIWKPLQQQSQVIVANVVAVVRGLSSYAKLVLRGELYPDKPMIRSIDFSLASAIVGLGAGQVALLLQ